MALIISSCGSSWFNHSAWSETYIGLRKLTYEILPNSISEMRAEDSSLCQLALVGANQLMELGLFSLFKGYINCDDDSFSITSKQFEEAGYYTALSKWVEKATGVPLDLNREPFISTEKLRHRRNDTVHKSAALADIKMARSAIYTAVEGVKELHIHFDKRFEYKTFIDKYPLEKEILFSQIVFPGE